MSLEEVIAVEKVKAIEVGVVEGSEDEVDVKLEVDGTIDVDVSIVVVPPDDIEVVVLVEVEPEITDMLLKL